MPAVVGRKLLAVIENTSTKVAAGRVRPLADEAATAEFF
jgi:hypothetical protein